MYTPVTNIERASNRLLKTAFPEDLNVLGNTNDRFLDLSATVGNLLLDDWEQTPGQTYAALKGAMVYACMPSLRNVMESKKHTHETAVAVSDELQSLCGYIVSNKFFDMRRRGKEERGEIKGQITEIAILGTVWWGIANGYRNPRTYMLPTTKKQDQSERIDGYKTGVDFLLRESGTKKRQFIQSKSHRNGDSLKNGTYHPGIAVVTPGDLTCRDNEPFGLVYDLARDNRRVLSVANQRFDELIEQSQTEAKRHKDETGFTLRQSHLGWHEIRA